MFQSCSLPDIVELCFPTIMKLNIDGSPPGSPVPGILQARTLEWVSISFSNAWKWNVKGKSPSGVRLVGTPWTAAYQAPPSMGFSRQEYWSGVPLPSLKDIHWQSTNEYNVPIKPAQLVSTLVRSGNKEEVCNHFDLFRINSHLTAFNP